MIPEESTVTCISLSLHGTQTALFEAERRVLLPPEERILPLFCPLSLISDRDIPLSGEISLLLEYRKRLKETANSGAAVGGVSLILHPPRRISGWICREVDNQALEKLFTLGGVALFEGYPPLPSCPSLLYGISGPGGMGEILPEPEEIRVSRCYLSVRTITISQYGENILFNWDEYGEQWL